MVHRPGANLQAAGAMSPPPRKKCEKDDYPVNKVIPVMDISTGDHEKRSPVLHVDHNLVPVTSE